MNLFFENIFKYPPKEILSHDITLNVNNIYYHRKLNYEPSIFYSILLQVLQYGCIKLFNHCEVNRLSKSDFNLLQSYFNSFGFRIMYAFDEIDGDSQGKMLRLWFKPIQEFKLCNGNIIYR